MTCVILQPSYIPWRGYFHQIHKADLFVFYDDVQYDERGWRNRNQIKTPTGLQWLTIPVQTKGVRSAKTSIKDIRMVPNTSWHVNHWRSLQRNYSRAPFFKQYAARLGEYYATDSEFLADFTIRLTIRLARELGIEHTQFVRSSELRAEGTKTDRLLSILTQVGAKHYVSGPSAKDYIEPEKFAAAGITLEYMNYNYPEYPQLYGAFEPAVTVLDLLFNVGADAPKFIWQTP